jgi:hypothetical protein
MTSARAKTSAAGRSVSPSIVPIVPSAGSAPITTMPIDEARRASARPIRPTPRMPSVFPSSSIPFAKLFLSQAPPFIEASARGICRARANMSPSASSATDTDDAAGVLSTRTPSASAAATSMLSTPTPPRTTTFSRSPAARWRASILVAERTTTAS